MKRTIIFLFIIAIVAIGTYGQYNEAPVAEQPTCCQMFKVVDSNGNPVGGCRIVVGPPCNTTVCVCTTGATGTCSVCVLTPGVTYTVTTDCGGSPVTFLACASAVVIIHVP